MKKKNKRILEGLKEYQYCSYRREMRADMVHRFAEGSPCNWWGSASSDQESGNERQGEGQTEYAVCMERFRPLDTVSPLPCNASHLFHTSCLRPWLQSN